MIDPLNHLIGRLREAKVDTDPFPHYCLDRVFPEQYYDQLLRHLPSSDVYENLYEVTDLKLDHFRHRYQRDLNDGWTNSLPPELQSFWNSFNQWFLSPELAQAVLASFPDRVSWPAVSVEAQ